MPLACAIRHRLYSVPPHAGSPRLQVLERAAGSGADLEHGPGLEEVESTHQEGEREVVLVSGREVGGVVEARRSFVVAALLLLVGGHLGRLLSS